MDEDIFTINFKGILSQFIVLKEYKDTLKALSMFDAYINKVLLYKLYNYHPLKFDWYQLEQLLLSLWLAWWILICCWYNYRQWQPISLLSHRITSLSQPQSYHLYHSLKISNLFVIMKTCPCNVCPLEPHFYIAKLGYAGVFLFFLFLLQTIGCGYSLEPPR